MIPKWTFLPDSMGQEYQAGATLIELSAKYGVCNDTITKKLLSLGVEIRTNYNPAKLPRKLTDQQIAWILEQDLNNVGHQAIASQVGVSRERVRQICLMANHATRRSRMVKGLQVAEGIAARKQARFEIIKEASEMYRAGVHLAVIHGYLRPNHPHPNTIAGATLVSSLRKKYPELFPYRIKKQKERTNDRDNNNGSRATSDTTQSNQASSSREEEGV